LIGLATIAVLIAAPFSGDAGWLQVLIEFMTYLALAQLWNLLAGYSGIISFGQTAWIGLGGYAMIVLADDVGINMFAACVLAGLFCALVALPSALLLFRLRGGYLSVGSLVLAEVFRLLVSSSNDWLKGEFGRTLAQAGEYARDTRELAVYGFTMLIGLGAVVLTYLLLRSRAGLGLSALRDSESAANALGVNTRRLKLSVFVLCALCTGIVGAAIYLNFLRIAPEPAFTVRWTAFMIFITMIGGIGTIEGPIIGTVLFMLVRNYLSDYGEWSMILFGAIAIVMMLVAPQGIWGLLHERFGIELFSVRRRLV
jgi:branched-chain amino acid transport system permease protein